MNGRISLWDWRESEEKMIWEGLENYESFQMPYFAMIEGKTRKGVFLDDNCHFHCLDLMSGTKEVQQLTYVEDSKIFVDKL